MDVQHAQALWSLRDQIRAVCVHDQAQWDATWKEALSDFSSSQRGLMLPSTFFEVLRANSVPLSRSEARVLLWQFQKPNGAVSATKFLRWIALSAPADHVNPDLHFPQLPQPYRRIMKVWDRDIFDAAWEIIATESARFKAETAAAEAAMNSSRSALGVDRPQLQRNDYDVAKRRTCEPSWRIPLDTNANQVAGLASHCLLPLVVAGINCRRDEDASPSTAPSLRVLSTADGAVEILGDFPLEFPRGDAEIPADAATKVHVTIKALSPLQLANDNSGLQSCCIAVHLLETTTSNPPQQEEAIEEVKPATPTTRECVNVYTIRRGNLQPSGDGTNPRGVSCELLAVLRPTQSSAEPSTSSLVLSPGVSLLAVMSVGSRIISVGSRIISVYSLRRDDINQDTEAVAQPLILSSPTYQVDLEPMRSPFMEDAVEPTLHFLVAPVTARTPCHEKPRAPRTYAFAVCYGLKVLKYLLPLDNTNSTSPPSPLHLTPTKSWEHLTRITASAQDMTTQYLVVGCQDGTVVVWDVLQDADYAFLAPVSEADNTIERPPARQKLPASTEVSHVVYCQAGYVVALSKSQQRLYFFDVRERGKPTLTRVISPPAKKSSTKTRQTSAQLAVLMVSIAASTAAADIPVALVEYSNGMVMLYDVRTAEAIGNFWATASTAASPAAHLTPSASSKSNESTAGSGAISITGNQEVLGVAASPAPSTEATDLHIKLFSWRDVLLVCFPSLAALLEQHQEEATITNIKQLLLTSDVDDVSAVAPPSTVTAPSTSVDQLETMLLRMAGDTPPSPTRTRQSIAGSLSPLQSPLGRSSVSIAPSNAPLGSPCTDSISSAAAIPGAMLEPLVPDDKVFFEEYCREHLDPEVIADKEAKMHRKRRELLKTMSAGGAW
ncbi:hypothetical protein PF008_g14370 [Phytophthora fragariae]|uniref:Uncharacterized protein n=1 Tax=Phytophthora fragariae TaxID=53985 RepID=A0A6G0RHA9_9STRA|nr:hypothetical protein PF008_g14370 [Phytophthora fragariae]